MRPNRNPNVNEVWKWLTAATDTASSPHVALTGCVTGSPLSPSLPHRLAPPLVSLRAGPAGHEPSLSHLLCLGVDTSPLLLSLPNLPWPRDQPSFSRATSVSAARTTLVITRLELTLPGRCEFRPQGPCLTVLVCTPYLVFPPMTADRIQGQAWTRGPFTVLHTYMEPGQWEEGRWWGEKGQWNQSVQSLFVRWGNGTSWLDLPKYHKLDGLDKLLSHSSGPRKPRSECLWLWFLARP